MKKTNENKTAPNKSPGKSFYINLKLNKVTFPVFGHPSQNKFLGAKLIPKVKSCESDLLNNL